jgi:membrane fusion protein (multidrug efflux system)
MRFKTINLIFIVLALFISCSKNEEQSQLSVPDIPVFETQEQEVPIYQEFVGQVYGYKDIAIRARVEGFLEEIHFQEGSRIAKDTLLYTLESQQFEADVAAKMSRFSGSRRSSVKG